MVPEMWGFVMVQSDSTIIREAEAPGVTSGGAFVVEVPSELSLQTMQRRWQAVNVILRLATLTGLPMQLDATLHRLTELAGEIAPHDRSLTFFWDENVNQLRLRAAEGVRDLFSNPAAQGNILNSWAMKYRRPLLVGRERNHEADSLLYRMQASSALVLPLFVSNQAMGSLQLFSTARDRFSQEDAQLLWILALAGDTLLTRDYLNEGLIRFAFTDYLTGLKTRGYFEQQLEMEIKRSKRAGTRFSLLMIDIDFFKQLNDHYGHHAGDQVLREVSALLVKDMREVDTVARFGGEEFVIVLPETGGAGARLVAERLRHAVEQSRFCAGSHGSIERLTISIGAAVFGQDAEQRHELIEFADTALYAAKFSGRNQVLLYSELPEERRKIS